MTLLIASLLSSHVLLYLQHSGASNFLLKMFFLHSQLKQFLFLPLPGFLSLNCTMRIDTSSFTKCFPPVSSSSTSCFLSSSLRHFCSSPGNTCSEVGPMVGGREQGRDTQKKMRGNKGSKPLPSASGWSYSGDITH